MDILLTCRECGHQEWSSTEKTLINKIIMWNHVKKVHPGMATRLMRNYNMLPNDFFRLELSHKSA